MKTLIRTFFVLLTVAAVLQADAVIVEFSGEPSEVGNRIYWQTGLEENVDAFTIQRSTNNTDFDVIGEVAAKGSNSEYEYTDAALSGMMTVYYYRLRVRNSDGTFQTTESISIIPNISSFSRTWGTIKALFQ